MGQTEVTVEAYKRFVRAIGAAMPPEPTMLGKDLNPGWSNDGLPMTMVTWNEAKDYCTRRVPRRDWNQPTGRRNGFGFRCGGEKVAP
jgi:formylglycine-generating enzyme required for sulfatase activity